MLRPPHSPLVLPPAPARLFQANSASRPMTLSITANHDFFGNRSRSQAVSFCPPQPQLWNSPLLNLKIALGESLSTPHSRMFFVFSAPCSRRSHRSPSPHSIL